MAGLWCALVFAALASAPHPTPRHAAPQAQAGRALRSGAPTSKNAIFVAPSVAIPYFGLGIGYDRLLHPMLALGPRFEYTFARRGYGQLQGFSEGLALTLWVPRFLRGVFAEASVSLAHAVFVPYPELHRMAVVLGLAAGGRWRFGRHFFVGGALGLRWHRLVRTDPAVCTRPEACPSVAPGVRALVRLEIGVGF